MPALVKTNLLSFLKPISTYPVSAATAATVDSSSDIRTSFSRPSLLTLYQLLLMFDTMWRLPAVETAEAPSLADF